MTHIENIPHVLQHGITHSTSPNSNPQFVPIGDSSLISARKDFVLNNGRRIGEYIPFYFAIKTPMLYVVQNGFNMVAPTIADNIIYCVSSVQIIVDQNLDFIFTDGHAVDSFSTQYNRAQIENIENAIDWNAVRAKYWKSENDLDLKRRKEAEFLVMGDISILGILGFIVYNENARNRLINYGVDPAKIYIKTEYYF